MPLSPGTRLGPYEILAPIGAGGMGEVYRARDTRLKRDVAIKVLPEAFASDADRLARFQREAEVVASLSHPNIAQIYGVEERALVLELVEGPTLADRIAQGPVPLDEALPIAREIAEALEAAHERGIIHRDLKPANIKLTPDGKVKVLDFGLAKAVDNAEAAHASNTAALSQSPTITSPAMTMGGVILGTAAYMSPEQAKGKPVDKRSDIWAYGCVLFEMLTGRRAFAGDDVTETLAFIITKEPDWAALPASTPDPVRRLLRRCLDKDRRRRLTDAGTARLELDEAADSPASQSPARGAARGRRAAWTWAALIAVAIVSALTTYAVVRPQSAPVRSAARFTFDAGRPVPQSSLAISPDGRFIAYTAEHVTGRASLFIRPVDSLDSREVPDTEGAGYPFWSPDSREIAFGHRRSLKKIGVTGGSPQVLTPTVGYRGGTWNAAGVILFAQGNQLFRINSSGGEPALVSTASDAAVTRAWPQWLTDRTFLYLKVTAESNRSGIYMASLDTADERLLVPSFTPAAYAGGYLFFLRERNLLAQRLDPSSGDLIGPPVPIADGITFNSGLFSAGFSVNADVLAFRTGQIAGEMEIAWFDRSGKRLSTSGQPASWWSMNLSEDGKHLALVRSEASGTDIWNLDLDRNIHARLTFDGQGNGDPNYSADGRSVFFSSHRRGSTEIFRKNASGVGDATLVATGGRVSDVSRDGKRVLQLRQGLTAINLEDSKATAFLAATSAAVDEARFSPDSRWVAFNRNETDREEVYVVSFPTGEQRWQVSVGGGVQPRWRRDGRELVYMAPDGTLMSVGVEEDKGGLRFTRPQPLFKSGARARSFTEDYDMTADAKRFVVLLPVNAGSSTPPATVILNWKAALPDR